ncbi:MAG: hypothetical protein ABFD12_00920 [Syntrophorhabdus sp.]
MSPHNQSKPVGIPLGAGLISGISIAVSIKMNISLDETYYLRMLLSTVCNVANTTFPKGTTWQKPDCGSYLMWFDIVTIIVFICTLIAAIKATGNFLEGIILYFIGIIAGFLLIFLFIQ